jgi:RNA polymerase sigma-70 factor (ECF subfamily)
MAEGTSRSLSTVFEEHLEGEPAPSDLESQLAALVEGARTAWPSIPFEPVAFLRYVAARIPRGDALAPALTKIHASDLLLAFACGRGDAKALDLFESAFFGDLGLILARLTKERHVVDEIAQTLRTKLFVPQGGSPARIADYAGRGDLRGWFRVTATRHAISHLRKPRQETDDDDALSLVPAAKSDPEMQYLRERYSEEFRHAFGEAAHALSSEERNLLRYHYVDRLNIDEIGGIYGIHRVSAARRLTKVRAALVDAVRQRLRERLHVGTGELQSILRLVKSDLHMSLRRVLDDGS